MWKLLKGFNSDEDFNEELDKVALQFVRIRLGDAPENIDEFYAGLYALKWYFLEQGKDSKGKKRNNRKEPGYGV